MTELVRAADRILAQRFSSVWVEGEVVGLKLVAAGHAYFTLKDPEAVIPVAMWRSSLARIRFRLEDGQRLRVLGKLGIYDRQGRFQLYADRVEPAGLGAWMLELEQRKARLAAEGLFDAAKKRPLPRWPRVIGVVTSADGAALRDILEVARQRCPSRIVVSPALVQGEGAEASLIRALERLLAVPEVDVVILGRGGGASEDLRAFHDEALVRAVRAFPVPVVSAVGHEVDVSLCDLAADVRAATPSHAAELVVPDLAGFTEALRHLGIRVARVGERLVLDRRVRLAQLRQRTPALVRDRVRSAAARLHALERRLQDRHPEVLLRGHVRRLAELRARLVAAGGRLSPPYAARLARLDERLRQRAPLVVQERRLRWTRAAATLSALSPLAVLERGYAVVRDVKGRVLVDAALVGPGDELELILRRGRVRARVVSVSAPATPSEGGPGEEDRS